MTPASADAVLRFANARRVLIVILLLAAALRVAALAKSLYIDEIVTLTVASQPLDRMGAVMRQIDASPALYPLLLHAWLRVWSADEWARLLSAIFGTAAVAVVYLLGRWCFSASAGLWGAFAAAIAPPQVHYSQYVRSYSLFALLASLHVLLTVRFIQSDARQHPMPVRLLLAQTAVTTALLYTHYVSVLLLMAEALWVAVAARHRPKELLAWAGAHVVAALLFLPGVPLLRHNIEFDRIRNEQRAERPPITNLVPTLVAELAVGQRALGFSDPRLRRAVLTASVVLFPVVVMAGVKAGWSQNRRAVVLLVCVSVLPAALYIGSGRRLVAVRFFVPFMAGYLVLLGAGLASLRGRVQLIAASAVVALCAVPLWHFYARYDWSYDHRAVANAVEQRLKPGDLLLFVHPYEALYYSWYLNEGVPMEGLVFTALADQGTYVIKPPPLDVARARARVLTAARTHTRLWVIGQSPRSFASDPTQERLLLQWMDATFPNNQSLPLTGIADPPVIRVYDVPARLRSVARGRAIDRLQALAAAPA